MTGDGLTAGYAYAAPIDHGFPRSPLLPLEVSWYGCSGPGVTTDPFPVWIPPREAAPAAPGADPDIGVVEEARAKLNLLEARRAVLESELALVVHEIETLRKMLAAVEASP